MYFFVQTPYGTLMSVFLFVFPKATALCYKIWSRFYCFRVTWLYKPYPSMQHAVQEKWNFSEVTVTFLFWKETKAVNVSCMTWSSQIIAQLTISSNMNKLTHFISQYLNKSWRWELLQWDSLSNFWNIHMQMSLKEFSDD